MLLKVVLLGYSRGLISSWDIERACHENVTFIMLSCDQRPDHSTIAAFVSSMKDQILSVFRDILPVCEEENLLGDTLFSLDGCKLPSNASSKWSGTINDLKKKKENIERKVDETDQKVLYRWYFDWPSMETGYEGKPERRRGVDVIKFQDGKIIEKLTYSKTTVEIAGERVRLTPAGQ